MKMSMEINTDWSKSVGAVVIKDNKVLLVRHTYGAGKGKLIIPGGYIQFGESPQEAATREVMEETSIKTKAKELIGIRFNEKDWYAIFTMEYIEGTPISDHDENSEAIFMDIEEALGCPDTAELSKILIRSAISGKECLKNTPFISSASKGEYSLYTL